MPYADPEKARAYYRERSRRQRAANPEKQREYQRRRRLANLEAERAKGRAWYWRNVERNRENDRRASRASLPTPTRPEPPTCEICGGTPQEGSPKTRVSSTLCLDHCHSTNTFRGWICKRCNLMLGYAKDRIETLLEAALYLERARE